MCLDYFIYIRGHTMRLYFVTPCILQTRHDQNRAFPGDEVAVVLNPESRWILQRFNLMKGSKDALAGLTSPSINPSTI